MGIKDVFASKQSVFNINDLALIWEETSFTKVQDMARYYARTGSLHRLQRGIYVKSLSDYSAYELASKLFQPSYISLETVLKNEGIIFQDHQAVFSIANKTKTYQIDGRDFYFKKIKKIALSNFAGIENKAHYWIASKERAFLDALYLYKDYHFDNLMSINWQKCFELVDLYSSKAMVTRLNKYFRDYA